jgi:hypothetical protein
MLGLPRILLVGIIFHSAALAQAPAATVDATLLLGAAGPGSGATGAGLRLADRPPTRCNARAAGR